MNPDNNARKKCAACETIRAVVRKTLHPILTNRSAKNAPADPIPTSNKRKS